MDWAVYDLNKNSPSFDFLTFMQGALQAKAGGIWFVPGTQNGPYGGEEGQKQRVETIIYPICELYKIPFRVESNPPPSVFSGHTIDILKKITKPFPLSPTQGALDRANDKLMGKRPIVVSLRSCPYHQGRNSSPDWKAWALDHEAYVVEDFYSDPITVDDRVALYELASLNMGVNSGFQMINLCSYKPYLIMKMINEEYKATRREYLERHGWKVGDQTPWATNSQRLIWSGTDNYETIDHEYKCYMESLNGG